MKNKKLKFFLLCSCLLLFAKNSYTMQRALYVDHQAISLAQERRRQHFLQMEHQRLLREQMLRNAMMHNTLMSNINCSAVHANKRKEGTVSKARSCAVASSSQNLTSRSYKKVERELKKKMKQKRKPKVQEWPPGYLGPRPSSKRNKNGGNRGYKLLAVGVGVVAVFGVLYYFFIHKHRYKIFSKIYNIF